MSLPVLVFKLEHHFQESDRYNRNWMPRTDISTKLPPKTYRHIIFALRRMTVQVPLLIHRGNAIKSVAHIGSNIIIPVLVQRKRATGVLHEQVQHADFVVANLGNLLENMVGDEVGAAAAGGKSEVFL